MQVTVILFVRHMHFVCRSFPARLAPVVQRKLLVTKAAEQETIVQDKKDLQNDVIFKPFEEV